MPDFDQTFAPPGERAFRVRVTKWAEGTTVSIGRDGRGAGKVQQMPCVTNTELRALAYALLEATKD